MDIELNRHGRWVEVNVEGRLDTFNFEPISTKISTLIRMGKHFISVNLEGVKFINVTAIHFLIATSDKLKSRQGHLALLFPSEELRAHLDMVNEPKSLYIYSSYEEIPS